MCRDVTLVDPLIEDYLTHPHCTYGSGRFALFPDVPIRRIALPIEDLDEREPFDLVVMINVLEHCYSLPKIFDTVRSLLKPGGTFVFHDKFLPSSDIDRFIESSFDAGHPLRVSGEVIQEFLNRHFENIYERRIAVPTEVCTFDAVYFVGRMGDDL
jgi:SAM-dependent methyltransferase